jgi:hypothetical protein
MQFTIPGHQISRNVNRIPLPEQLKTAILVFHFLLIDILDQPDSLYRL